MKNNKLKIIFAILGAVGGLFTIAADVGGLFVKEDEPQCPFMQLSFKDDKENE